MHIKLEQACTNVTKVLYRSCSEIEQACTNFTEAVYRSCSEIEQACTNFIEVIYRCVQKKNRPVLILQRLYIGVSRNRTGLFYFYRGPI